MGEAFRPTGLSKSRRYRHFLFVAAALCILLYTYFTFVSSSRPVHYYTGAAKSSTRSDRLYGKDYHGRSSADVNRVANDTLGFSKIFVVGLPDRTDRRDAMALTSAATGFHLEFVDGVKGQSVPDSAVPYKVDRVKLMEGNLGSWRGHMNAIRRYGYLGSRTSSDPSVSGRDQACGD